MKQVNIYSDGSSLGNPGPGGWGTILEYNGREKELSGNDKSTTNNKMELTGVIEGLKALKAPCEVKIFSDSNYVVKGINEWLSSWIKNNWRTSNKKAVKNKNLWIEYIKYSEIHNIEAIWVKGHNGHEYNERCDKLATEQANIAKDKL